ncbi:MAG TPA: EB domain-containing protein, partial [Polyangia bacterium]
MKSRGIPLGWGAGKMGAADTVVATGGGVPGIRLVLAALFVLAACQSRPSDRVAAPELNVSQAALVGAACTVTGDCGGGNQVCIASVCECEDGFYNNGGACSPCHSTCATCSGPTADHCTSCSPNALLAFDVGDACATNADCTPLAVPNSTSGVCTANVCTLSTCAAGYFVDGAVCTGCTAINNCASGLTCTTLSDETCGTCSAGYAGTTCQYSDAVTCNGNGTAQANGSCSCVPGSTGANCAATLCLANQYVSNHACVACAAGSTRTAGDDATGGDTVCAATTCLVDQYVSNHACVACAPGSTRTAGDDATGADTVCAATTCLANQYVSNHACVACAPGST